MSSKARSGCRNLPLGHSAEIKPLGPAYHGALHAFRGGPSRDEYGTIVTCSLAAGSGQVAPWLARQLVLCTSARSVRSNGGGDARQVVAGCLLTLEVCSVCACNFAYGIRFSSGQATFLLAKTLSGPVRIGAPHNPEGLWKGPGHHDHDQCTP